MNRVYFWLAFVALFLSAACSRNEESPSLPASQPSHDFLTCIVPHPSDSSSLLLGYLGPRFACYRISDGFTDSYPLPDSTANWKTYDILPVSPVEFLVAKSNHGVMYVRYGIDSVGLRTIEHVASVLDPDPLGPPPHKGSHYSAYSLTRADSLIVIGSTNGLMYLAPDSLNRLAIAPVVRASAVRPLASLRNEKPQFLQEAVLFFDDSVTTATDNGIYRVALADFNRDVPPVPIGGKLRCRSAAVSSDSLMVIYSPDPASRRMASFPLHGRVSYNSVNVHPSTSWIGRYGDSIRLFGAEGDFANQRSAVNAGSLFWFIRKGRLHYSDPAHPSDGSDEHIVLSDSRSGIGISDRNGLWRLDGGKAKFLGDVRGLSGIKDISANSDHLFLVVPDGVFRVSLTDYLFPVNRDTTLVLATKTGSDRAVSVFATDSVLLVGTREALYAFNPDSRDLICRYSFARLEKDYENPYVCRITASSRGGYLVQTLNHGVWHIGSVSDTYATPVDSLSSLPPGQSLTWPELHRPAVTWQAIGKYTIFIFIGILCLFGLFYLAMSAVRLRHRLEMKAANEKIRRLDDTEKNLAELRSERNEALRLENKPLGRELSSLTRHIESALQSLDPSSPVAVFLSGELVPIRTYLCDENPDSSLTEQAETARRDVDEYTRFCTERLYRLASFKPLSGPFAQPMSVYSKYIFELGDVSSQPLKRRLQWIVDSAPVLQRLLGSCRRNIEAELSDCRPAMPQSAVKYALPVMRLSEIRRLWEGCVQPFIEHPTRLKISDKPFDTLPPDSNAVMIVALTFYGLRRFDVEGNNFRQEYYCPRTLTRFDKSSNIGSLYRLWAGQLTDGCFRYGPDTVPGNPAELLWHVCLSRLTFSILDSVETAATDNKVTLSHGIRLSFYVSHNLPIPVDIDRLRNNRIQGRPKNPD